MNLVDLKRELQNLGISIITEGLKGDDRYNELKRRWDSVRGPDNSINSNRQPTDRNDSNGLSLLSMSEIRARLTTLGIDCSTPGLSGEDRWKALLQRLQDAIEGRHAVPSSAHAATLSTNVTAVTISPSHSSNLAAPPLVTLPTVEELYLQDIQSLKKQIKRLRNKRSLMVASLCGDTNSNSSNNTLLDERHQDEHLRQLSHTLGCIESDLSQCKSLLQRIQHAASNSSTSMVTAIKETHWKTDLSLFQVKMKYPTTIPALDSFAHQLEVMKESMKEAMKIRRQEIKVIVEADEEIGIGVEQALQKQLDHLLLVQQVQKEKVAREGVKAATVATAAAEQLQQQLTQQQAGLHPNGKTVQGFIFHQPSPQPQPQPSTAAASAPPSNKVSRLKQRLEESVILDQETINKEAKEEMIAEVNIIISTERSMITTGRSTNRDTSRSSNLYPSARHHHKNEENNDDENGGKDNSMVQITWRSPATSKASSKEQVEEQAQNKADANRKPAIISPSQPATLQPDHKHTTTLLQPTAALPTTIQEQSQHQTQHQGQQATLPSQEEQEIQELLYHAKLLQQVDDHLAAEILLERAIEIDPTNIQVLQTIAAFLHQKKGELSRAEAFYHRALQCCIPSLYTALLQNNNSINNSNNHSNSSRYNTERSARAASQGQGGLNSSVGSSSHGSNGGGSGQYDKKKITADFLLLSRKEEIIHTVSEINNNNNSNKIRPPPNHLLNRQLAANTNITATTTTTLQQTSHQKPPPPPSLSSSSAFAHAAVAAVSEVPDSHSSNYPMPMIIQLILGYTNFLLKAKGDIENANFLLKKAILLQPRNARILGYYAHFLTIYSDCTAIQKHLQELFLRTLQLDATATSTATSTASSSSLAASSMQDLAQYILHCMWYGKFFKKIKEMEQAEQWYATAWQLTSKLKNSSRQEGHIIGDNDDDLDDDGKNSSRHSIEATAICNYASFLYKRYRLSRSKQHIKPDEHQADLRSNPKQIKQKSKLALAIRLFQQGCQQFPDHPGLKKNYLLLQKSLLKAVSASYKSANNKDSSKLEGGDDDGDGNEGNDDNKADDKATVSEQLLDIKEIMANILAEDDVQRKRLLQQVEYKQVRQLDATLERIQLDEKSQRKTEEQDVVSAPYDNNEEEAAQVKALVVSSKKDEKQREEEIKDEDDENVDNNDSDEDEEEQAPPLSLAANHHEEIDNDVNDKDDEKMSATIEKRISPSAVLLLDNVILPTIIEDDLHHQQHIAQPDISHEDIRTVSPRTAAAANNSLPTRVSTVSVATRPTTTTTTNAAAVVESRESRGSRRAQRLQQSLALQIPRDLTTPELKASFILDRVRGSSSQQSTHPRTHTSGAAAATSSTPLAASDSSSMNVTSSSSSFYYSKFGSHFPSFLSPPSSMTMTNAAAHHDHFVSIESANIVVNEDTVQSMQHDLISSPVKSLLAGSGTWSKLEAIDVQELYHYEDFSDDSARPHHHNSHSKDGKGGKKMKANKKGSKISKVHSSSTTTANTAMEEIDHPKPKKKGTKKLANSRKQQYHHHLHEEGNDDGMQDEEGEGKSEEPSPIGNKNISKLTAKEDDGDRDGKEDDDDSSLSYEQLVRRAMASKPLLKSSPAVFIPRLNITAPSTPAVPPPVIAVAAPTSITTSHQHHPPPPRPTAPIPSQGGKK